MKTTASFLLAIIVCAGANAQPYLPLSGGTLTGSLNVNGPVSINRAPLFLAAPNDYNHAIGTGIENFRNTTDGETFSYWSWLNFRSASSGGSAVFIGADGKVGIGTTGPSEKLEVAGNIKSAGFYNISLSGSNSRNSLQSLGSNDPSLSWGWIAADFGGLGTENKVVLGSGFGGSAILGAHNAPLTAWANLCINPTPGPAGGNVGIGTTAPAYKLDVNGQVHVSSWIRYNDNAWIGPASDLVAGLSNATAANSLGLRADNNIIFSRSGALESMRIDGNGNVGIGLSDNIQSMLTLGGGNLSFKHPDNSTGLKEGMTWRPEGSWSFDAAYIKGFREDVPGAPYAITFGTGRDLGTSEKMRIGSNGNVGIGTTAPLAMLHVNGKVLIGTPTTGNAYNPSTVTYMLDIKGSARADKLVVNTTGADFVFEPSYKLRPLAEVEGFVKQNRHLPGIAPAAEMQKDGIELGAHQSELLQKVEELTLYAIAQEKGILQNMSDNREQQLLIREQGKWNSKLKVDKFL